MENLPVAAQLPARDGSGIGEGNVREDKILAKAGGLRKFTMTGLECGMGY